MQKKETAKSKGFAVFSLFFQKETGVFGKAVWTKEQKNGTLKHTKNKRKEEKL